MISTIGQVLGLLLALLLTPYELRAMGPERYAIVAVMVALTDYFAFVDLGAGWALSRFIPYYGETAQYRKIGELTAAGMALTAAMGVAACGLILIATPWTLARLAISPDVAPSALFAFRMAAVIVPLMLLSNLLAGVGRGTSLFRASSAITLASFVLLNMWWALVARSGRAIEYVTAGMAAIAVLRVVLWLVVLRDSPVTRCGPFRIRLSALREIMAFGVPSSVSAGGWLMLTSADRLVLAAAVPGPFLAGYIIASSLAQRLTLVCMTVATVLFPRLSATARSAESTAETLLATSSILGLVTGFMVFSLFWAGPAFVSVWIGPDFASANASTLRLLTFGFGLLAVSLIDVVYLEAHGRVVVTAVASGVCGITGLALVFLGARIGQVEGAAAAMCLALGILFVSRTSLAARALRISWWRRTHYGLQFWPALCGVGGLSYVGAMAVGGSPYVLIPIVSASTLGASAVIARYKLCRELSIVRNVKAA
ncbi:MAG: MATE family efflux transporter [Actinomycetota bacterium]|nr:MATE family efflux transporter [Actinomycetota bacterium]